MAFFRMRTHRSEWKRAQRRAVNDALAEADAQTPSRLDRWDRPTEDWTPEQSDALLAMLRREGA